MPGPSFAFLGGMITAYEVLGVSKESSLEEIKSHFRRRLPLYHPDRCSGRELRDYLDYRRAYDILRDPLRREKMADLPLFGDHLRYRADEIRPELRQFFENLAAVQEDIKKRNEKSRSSNKRAS